jgi:GntR family transcriptional regulator/MocR family aminotransferase
MNGLVKRSSIDFIDQSNLFCCFEHFGVVSWMLDRRSVNELGFLRLDGRRKLPMFRQLYDQIRKAILEGRVKSECRIPSSRDLMEQLGVSRTTVVSAIEMLIAEGYLVTSHGRGTFVSSDIPDEQVKPQRIVAEESSKNSSASNHLGQYGKSLLKLGRANLHTGESHPFCPGEPALDEFPLDVWSRIVRRIWKSIDPRKLSYGEPAGYGPLRVQVADYLSVRRGVSCDPSQVMIVNGTQQAVDIVARISLDHGDEVLFENPGYVSARDAFSKRGAKVLPMNVGASGANVEEAIRKHGDARLAYVTPSHQYPLGVTLPIEKRLALIRWANESQSLILEDDYDSEYRYSQQPLPCMQGLDQGARTIYVGSFSKVVFPALGLGYAIVPTSMVTAFENALRLVSRLGSQVDQIALSEFIREGHFVRHLRRMRKTHALRREVFVAELKKRLSDKLEVIGTPAGLHCTSIIKTKQSDIDLVARFAEMGVVARALSEYYLPGTPKRLRKNGLVFGFAASEPQRIRKRIREIAELFD